MGVSAIESVVLVGILVATGVAISGLVIGTMEGHRNRNQTTLLGQINDKNMALMAADMFLLTRIATESAAQIAADAMLQTQLANQTASLEAHAQKVSDLAVADDVLQTQITFVAGTGTVLVNETLIITTNLASALLEAADLETRTGVVETNAVSTMASVVTQTAAIGGHETRIAAMEVGCPFVGHGGNLHMYDPTTVIPVPNGLQGWVPAAALVVQGSNPDGMPVTGAGATIVNAGVYRLYAYNLNIGVLWLRQGMSITINAVRVNPVFNVIPTIMTSISVAQVDLLAGDVIGVEIFMHTAAVIPRAGHTNLVIHRVH